MTETFDLKEEETVVKNGEEKGEENTETDPKYFKSIVSFEELNLKEELLRGIYSYGFEKPSTIQQKAIYPCLCGKDMIAQAQSGTGKTATFVITILQKIDFSLNACQSLVLVPTRELAQQIQKVTNAIGQYCNVKCHACVGGTRVSEDINTLKSGVHVVVGTPGRIFHMIEQKYLDVKCIQIFVLDEADEMLSADFKDQIQSILKSVPGKAQVLLLSATLPNEVLVISDMFMRKPCKILVKKEELTLDGIKQFFVAVENTDQKLLVLNDIYSIVNATQAVIFVNSRKTLLKLKEWCDSNNFSCLCMYGEMEQKEREKSIQYFRNNESRILLCTDLIARGIDVQQVSLVINFELPINQECYIHRIGRSGRFGRKGVAINLVSSDEQHLLDGIQKFYSTKIIEMPSDVAKYI